MKQLDISKATGIDTIPTHLIKLSADDVTRKHFTKTINTVD